MEKDSHPRRAAGTEVAAFQSWEGILKEAGAGSCASPAPVRDLGRALGSPRDVPWNRDEARDLGTVLSVSLLSTDVQSPMVAASRPRGAHGSSLPLLLGTPGSNQEQTCPPVCPGPLPTGCDTHMRMPFECRHCSGLSQRAKLAAVL